MIKLFLKIFNNRNSIKIKLIYRMLLIFSFLFLAIFIIVILNFRQLGIQSAKKEAESIARLTRDALTSFMIMDTMQHRSIFFESLKYSTSNLNSLRVLRGDSVIAQHGPPLKEERPQNDLEFLALSSGTKQERLYEKFDSLVYELVLPYIATTEGNLNCLACHIAKEGDVLGAVSISIDISRYRKTGLNLLLLASVITFIFFVLTIYMVFHFFEPYTTFFTKLKKIFANIQEGHFQEKITFNSNDEAGAVASNLNIMIDRLSFTLGNIRKKISLLIGHSVNITGNDLQDTSTMVNELVKIYNFKRTIESDSDTYDIYRRIGDMLENFGIYNFSFYEVDKNRNLLIPISNFSKPDIFFNIHTRNKRVFMHDKEDHCKKIILSNADECRAQRTGQIVDSTNFSGICPNFIYTSENLQRYYCIPLYLNREIYAIIQLVYWQEEKEKILSKIPFIKIYLKEATPILEARLYMKMLEQKSIIDQLTGLYNRHFLEDFSQKLEAQTNRHKSLIGILMLDIDYFKDINDTYGHDIGDLVLQNVANILKKNIREADFVIRFGGEEFLLLLMDIESQEQALKVAEKLRKLIESSLVKKTDIQVQAKISIGVAMFPPNSNEFWQCIKYADMALYKAKRLGRNQVVTFEESLLKENQELTDIE